MIVLVSQISIGILLIAFVLTIIRLIIGPTLPDRVVSVDLAGTLSMALIVASLLKTGYVIYIDVVLIVSIILFMGTVIVAKYLQKKKYDD
jgi:multisubunit Na+/H+ antiporter MnhF subunit